jgi:hypothetical protein
VHKKIFAIFIVCLVISISIPIFAAPDDDSFLNENIVLDMEEDDLVVEEIERITAEKDTEDTEQFLLTITRPDGDEITPRKSYVVCGVAEEKNPEDLVVVLSIYNESTEMYERFENIDGESSWEVGSFGMFTKEIMLKEGANKLKIVVYQKSADNLQVGVNVQVNSFTVTVLKEGIKQKIINGTLRINEIFQGILPSPIKSN